MRARAVRRNTVLLSAAQAAVQAGATVLLVVGSVAAAELSGHASTAGVLSAIYFVAAAIGAVALGRAMDRFGRRPGLLASYALVVVAGIACLLAVRAGSWVALLLAAVPFGVAFGGANLARGAVADMYPSQRRGRAVGVLLAASTIGAAGGPQAVAAIQRQAERGGWDPLVAPWALVVGVGVIAIACVLAVRPDPRALAVTEAGASSSSRPALSIVRAPAVLVAIVAAAVGQVAMVGVMSVTPIALHDHGHGPGVISVTISLHVIGMFAFSPFIGAALDRWGRRPGLIAGALGSAAGAMIAGASTTGPAIAAGLWLVGLGWSATYLGATAVISDVTSPGERAGTLGLTDLVISACSAIGALGAGVVFEGAGFTVLGVSVAVLALAVVATVLVRAPVPDPRRSLARPPVP